MDPSLGKWVSFILATSCWVGAVRGLGCPYLASCQWGRPVRAADVYPRGSGLRKSSEGSEVDIHVVSEVEPVFCWPAAAAAKSHQSCLTLCDPTDGSPPGSSVPGILQARILEWVAISFSIVDLRRSKLSKLRKEGANRILGQTHSRTVSLIDWNQVAVVTLSGIWLVLNKFLVLSPDLLI